MIKHLSVEKLFGKYDFDIPINNDLTLFTGQNGSGKTTLLKLLWSLVTPNRTVAINEVPCERARVATELYDLELTPDVYKTGSGPRVAHFVVALHQKGDSDPAAFDVCYDDDGFDRDGALKARTLNAMLEPYEFNTIFFPTFRLIEGGFNGFVDEDRPMEFRRGTSVPRAFDVFAGRLSNDKHKFVASLSTQDVEEKLLQVYTEITEETNRLYLEFSKNLEREPNRDALPEALSELKRKRDACKHPLDELSDLVRATFKDKGVRISKSLVLGDAATAIDCRNLSAGEKQMFSFLSYNAFCEKTVVFIDEPELSLHVDWQRLLFKKLRAQESTNQFLATTHSPFIYSADARNEFFIDQNRGWHDGDLTGRENHDVE